MLTDDGALPIAIPRDRAGTFEPQPVKKRSCRLVGFDDKVISLYARDLTTRDIQAHQQELYGAEVSPELVSAGDRVGDRQPEGLADTAPRGGLPHPLLRRAVGEMRQEGPVAARTVYLALAVNLQGEKELLGQ